MDGGTSGTHTEKQNNVVGSTIGMDQPTRDDSIIQLMEDTPTGGTCDQESTRVSSSALNIGEEPPLFQAEKLLQEGIESAGDGDEGGVSEEELHSWRHILTKTLVPDDCFELRNMRLLDGSAVVKLLKFTSLTFLGIVVMFHFVRWVGWEHDYSLQLSDVFVYDLQSIATDIVFFFVVGRLHQQRGVDTLEWFGWVVLANFYFSYATTFDMLQYSFSLYEMVCRWPAGLWVLAVLIVLFVGVVIFLHVRFAVRQGILLQKITELILSGLVFVVPNLTSPYVHLHHWFVTWFAGMHFNFNVWWSRAIMAFCWGSYINGIAVYGRDPVLGCDAALYTSAGQDCPFLECYWDAISNNGTNATDYEPLAPLDWRNCSAYDEVVVDDDAVDEPYF